MSSGDETFEISTDCGQGWARIAFVGSAGSEVLVVFPYVNGGLKENDDLNVSVMGAGEATLRRALLALIKSNWINDGS